jgi:shikimate kinase
MESPRSVVALGGGALMDEASFDLVCRSGTVIWLWASPGVCAARADAASRPLIDAGDPLATLTRILESRFEHYAQAASLIVDTDDRTADAVAGKIADEVNSARQG